MACGSVHVANADRSHCTPSSDVLDRLRSDFTVLPDLSRIGIEKLAFQHNGGTFTLNPTRTSCELRITCDSCLAMVSGACGWCSATQSCVAGDGSGPAVSNPVCGVQPIVIDELVSTYGPPAGLTPMPPPLVDTLTSGAIAGDDDLPGDDVVLNGDLTAQLVSSYYDAGFYRHYLASPVTGRSRCPFSCQLYSDCDACNDNINCGWCETTDECVSISAVQVEYEGTEPVEGGEGLVHSNSPQCRGSVLVDGDMCPASRCRRLQSFGECSQDTSCGWCSNRTVAISTDRGPYCFEGDSFGPVTGACASG